RSCPPKPAFGRRRMRGEVGAQSAPGEGDSPRVRPLADSWRQPLIPTFSPQSAGRRSRPHPCHAPSRLTAFASPGTVAALSAGSPMLSVATLWIPFTIVAALGQVARNAMQRSLTGPLGTWGATNIRFLFGFPFSILFFAG